jgi:hypothetical protein
MNPDEDIQRIDKCLQELGEYFDSVHVFATRHEPEVEDGTVSCNKGVGNWFCRYGQIREWVIKREEQQRVEAQREMD